MAAAGIAGTGTHTVRSGETASQIAADNGTSVEALAAANGLRDPNLVVIGSTLVIPGAWSGGAGGGAGAGGGSYTVKQGDTLSSIAAAAGTSVDALAKANGISDPHMIYAGRVIKLPAASAGSSSTTGLPALLLARPARLALRPTFERWSARYGVPADLVEALAWMESGWQNSVVSSTNAVGIGQLMPETVDFLQLLLGDQGLDPTVPEHNIRMTARFVRYLLDQTGGDVAMSLAAYYQGLQSVRTRPLYEDTKQYVAIILALRTHFD